MEEAIRAIGLTKKYGKLTAVNGLDLVIPQGELFSLLGVNGAGKTTTIKMLSCLTRPTDGDALLLGSSVVSDTAKAKQKIAVSPQETAVAPNLTVKENLALICGIYGFGKEKRQKKIEELSQKFGLEEILCKRRASSPVAGSAGSAWRWR